VVHLPFGQHHELVENPGFVPVVATVTVTMITVTVLLLPFEPRQLVAEEAHSLRVTVVLRLTNGLTDFAREPGVEATVDLPLSMSVTAGNSVLPTLGNPNDLLEVLPLIEVRTLRVVDRP